MTNMKLFYAAGAIASLAAGTALAETAHEAITHAHGASEHAHLMAETTDAAFDPFNHIIDEAI
ncbi:MAG: hypothetical protein RIT14_2606, partial [Pseudomonadota bacterium]